MYEYEDDFIYFEKDRTHDYVKEYNDKYFEFINDTLLG